MLWGRGAVDMKNMDAMILTALGDILGADKRPARDLIVAFFADEEDGGVLGSHYLVDEHPELFAGATEAISEVGGYSITLGDQRAYLLQTGEKALLWMQAHRPRRRPRTAPGSCTTTPSPARRGGRAARPHRVADPAHRTPPRELLAAIADMLGVDPEQVGPDELAIATGSASGFIHGHACAPPRTPPRSPPATSTT